MTQVGGNEIHVRVLGPPFSQVLLPQGRIKLWRRHNQLIQNCFVGHGACTAMIHGWAGGVDMHPDCLGDAAAARQGYGHYQGEEVMFPSDDLELPDRSKLAGERCRGKGELYGFLAKPKVVYIAIAWCFAERAKTPRFSSVSSDTVRSFVIQLFLLRTRPSIRSCMTYTNQRTTK
jgi:hypothetical protein